MSNVLLKDCHVPAWLTALAADCLESGERTLNPSVPLKAYGLDSLSALGLAMGIEERTGCDVLEFLLQEDRDLQSIAQFLESVEGDHVLNPLRRSRRDETASQAASTQQQMLADSILPEDVVPGPGARVTGSAKVVLLTGATGFLGAYLLRALLRTTTVRVCCLVRQQSPMHGRERIRRNLEHYGIWDRAFEDRIDAVGGDMLQPNLGLSRFELESLASEVDEIVHCAALVNWVFSYEGLRDANVGGTLELLRLACRHRPKPFHFVSTLSVCCPSPGPATLAEGDEVFVHRDGLHLGYAQTKCVAEALVRSAAARGLPVTIHRPSWISGDSESGVSNPDDLLALMMKGCIWMGCAPDLDLIVDACPVDHVAAAIVALARNVEASGVSRAPPVYHFINPGPSHWREVVLWMNLYGYPIRLIPHQEWLARLEIESRATDHPLHYLSPFFLTKAAGLTLPEHYEVSRRPHVCAARTRSYLDCLSITSPVLTTSLLDRYFQSFIERKFLPNPSPPSQGGERGGVAFGNPRSKRALASSSSKTFCILRGPTIP